MKQKRRLLPMTCVRQNNGYLLSFPVQRRTVYALSRYEEKDTEEIANMLNLSQRTVDYHLFLGRRDMRRYMKNCI